MSTPKISFRVPTPGGTDGDATGDVITQDLSMAPGKEREREPLYGGDIGNLTEGMIIDTPIGGECHIPLALCVEGSLCPPLGLHKVDLNPNSQSHRQRCNRPPFTCLLPLSTMHPTQTLPQPELPLPNKNDHQPPTSTI